MRGGRRSRVPQPEGIPCSLTVLYPGNMDIWTDDAVNALLPDDAVWLERDFPDANMLLLGGELPTVVDTGFVAHADATVALAAEHLPRVTQVANTHWHSDHVGGNARLQRAGAEILGSRGDADALTRADPDCCVAEYLDQPVPRYTVDRCVGDGDRVLLGDSEWTVLEVPGHTAGHLAYWNPEDRVLVAGDTFSSYDIGWVNVMLDGPGMLDTAAASLTRLQEYDARIILPGHGPAVTDPETATAAAVRRIGKQRENLGMAVNYGAKRILSFALMLRGGMRVGDLDDYLMRRRWVRDAAALLDQSAGSFVRELVDPMIAGGALTVSAGTVRASTPAAPVDSAVFGLPWPREWS